MFGCFEVTIGFGGIERVDYLTYDTKDIWRCYEIKVSKSDFHSKAHHTFIGNYNYYVIPKKLYDELQNEIPEHIGVYCGGILCKKAKKQILGIDEQILKDSMIRSLYREYEKFIETCDTQKINNLNNKISKLQKESRENHNRYLQYSNAIYIICDKYNLNFREVKQLVRDNL